MREAAVPTERREVDNTTFGIKVVDGNSTYSKNNWRSRPVTIEEQTQRLNESLEIVDEYRRNQQKKLGLGSQQSFDDNDDDIEWDWNYLINASSLGTGNTPEKEQNRKHPQQQQNISGCFHYEKSVHPLSVAFYNAINYYDNGSCDISKNKEKRNEEQEGKKNGVEEESSDRRRNNEVEEVRNIVNKLEQVHVLSPLWKNEYKISSSCLTCKKQMLNPLRNLNNPNTKQFIDKYEQFICCSVLPILSAALIQRPSTITKNESSKEQKQEEQQLNRDDEIDNEDEQYTSFAFQSFPCMRIQQPSQYSTIRPHLDDQYGHIRNTLNIWIPLTNIHGPSATLQIEKVAGSRCFVPLDCVNVGEYCVGDMCSLTHYTIPNETNATRISLDARVVPYESYRKSLRHDNNNSIDGENNKNDQQQQRYRVGSYFSLAKWSREKKQYVVTVHGRPSRQHGFPHTNKP